jgi:short-subunit dehydrogenase
MDALSKYGPWVLIAGASEGTGAAFAHRLAEQGFKLILVARRAEPLEKLAAMLKAKHGTESVTASIDLSRPDAIDAIKAVSAGREVGLYISNAGGDTQGTGFFDADIAAWTELVTRNVLTVMHTAHLLGGAMRERGRGGILLVGSGACYGGASGLGPYAGSKAFDLCLGEALWAELRGHGVDVLNLILGRMDTPELRRWLAARGAAVPEGLANADDVARVGLERLPHGPIHNWALVDQDRGPIPQSATERRDRVLAMEAAMADLFASNGAT